MQKLKSSDWIENGYVTASRKHLNEFVDTHSHDFFELEFILSGKGSYTIDGVRYPVRAGCIFFLTPMNLHSVDIEDAEIYNVMFSGDICNATFLSRITHNAPIILNTSDAVCEYFKTLLEELSLNYSNQQYGFVLLDSIIAKLDYETTRNRRLEKTSAITQAELFIVNNFKGNLVLKDAANHVALSPTYFSQLFVEKTGVNFKVYLNTMRFEYAKKLLKFSDMTVLQICNECGFNDYPNFIRRFKQYAGVYPAEYRKRHQET